MFDLSSSHNQTDQISEARADRCITKALTVTVGGNTQNYGNVVELVSASEISVHFSRLSKDDNEKRDALDMLTKIADKQRYTVFTEHFDQIFSVIFFRCDNIKEGASEMNFYKTMENDTRKKALMLLNKISEFQPFYIFKGIKKRHLKMLHFLLPDEFAFRTLGNFAVLNENFAKFIIDLGFSHFLPKLTEEKLPLFVWFLGCFSSYQSMSDKIWPFVGQFVLKGSHDQNDFMLQKHSLHSLSKFIMSSIIMANNVASYQYFQLIFDNINMRYDVVRQMMNFILSLLKYEITSFIEFKSTRNIICFGLQCEQTDVKLTTLDVISRLIVLGFYQYVHDHFLSQILDVVKICNNGSATYAVKESALKVICHIFANGTTQNQKELIAENIPELIYLSIEANEYEGDLHRSGVLALNALISFYQINKCEIIKQEIDEIATLLSADEYNVVCPLLMDD